MTELDAPFPYFGGKSKVTDKVWEEFSPEVKHYIEPFCGSAAVLLQRPGGARDYHYETINDKDGFVANVWRSIKLKPNQVTKWADWQISETDLKARCDWLIDRKETLPEDLRSDPEYCDPKAAGYWIWGKSCWIGSGFPHTSNKRPSTRVQGVNKHSIDTEEIIELLSDRLKQVHVLCGDWYRLVASESSIRNNISTDREKAGIFLDPPYPDDGTIEDVYSEDSDDIAYEVVKWCIENGDNPNYRIALCGYEDLYDMPDDWRKYRWQANGGYSNHSEDNSNKFRECIWFSPHCLGNKQKTLI